MATVAGAGSAGGHRHTLSTDIHEENIAQIEQGPQPRSVPGWSGNGDPANLQQEECQHPQMIQNQREGSTPSGEGEPPRGRTTGYPPSAASTGVRREPRGQRRIDLGGRDRQSDNAGSNTSFTDKSLTRPRFRRSHRTSRTPEAPDLRVCVAVCHEIVRQRHRYLEQQRE
jgi:hypothetical protein